MERLVLFLTGFWLWLTRAARAARYREAARELHAAWAYLRGDFANRASTRDRGFLLPEQRQALELLAERSKAAFRTASRFNSIGECVRMAADELGVPRMAASLPFIPSLKPIRVRASVKAIRAQSAAALRSVEFPGGSPEAADARQAA